MLRGRPPYGGGVFIADGSAWARAHHARAATEWSAALRNGQIATCPIVSLELLYSARDGAGFDRLAADLAQLGDVPITRSVANAALGALRKLAHAPSPRHRAVKLPDLLIAAAAQDASLGVLHYDEHFHLVASAPTFEIRSIA